MKPQHIRLDREHPEARFSSVQMPKLEFRQALYHSPMPGWQKRLYPASLMVTTTAFDADGRVLVADHQSMRFAILYNATWPEPVFRKLRGWTYKPVELRKDAPVVGWLVEMRMRDLRLGPEEWVEVIFLG